MTVNGPLDYEAVGGAHDITVVAASDDGSSSHRASISVTDDLDEHDGVVGH